MNLHRSCGLCTLTADALIEPIDALNVGALVTDQNDAIRVSLIMYLLEVVALGADSD